MNYAKARDANERAIVKALESVGAAVIRLHTPVDLLVGYRGANFLIECKRPKGPRGGTKDRKLTDTQRMFFKTWRGHARVVRSPHEALCYIGAIRDDETASIH